MRKTVSTLIVAAAVLVAGVVMAGKQCPETVSLDQAKAKKTAVTMNHKAHVALTACTTCHHTNKELTATSNVEVATCASCHLDPAKPETPSMREMSLTKNPFHKLCIDCHKKQAKGPAKCADCHKA